MVQQTIPRPLHPHGAPNTGDSPELGPKWDDVIQAINTMTAELYGGVPVAAAGFNTNTATAGATLTAAQITGGIHSVDLALTGTLAGAANAQLPTAASVLTALGSSVKVGHSFKLRVCNQSSGNFAWTVTTNTGWTLTGTMSIPQNTWREFVMKVTGASTLTLQSVATGTFS